MDTYTITTRNAMMKDISSLTFDTLEKAYSAYTRLTIEIRAEGNRVGVADIRLHRNGLDLISVYHFN